MGNIYKVGIAGMIVCFGLAGCGASQPGQKTEQPTAVGSATSRPSASPAASSSAAATESPRATAIRLATAQVKAYIDAYVKTYSEPDLAVSALSQYAEDQALASIEESIKARRDKGERWVGQSTITKTWLGPGGVVFHHSPPMAVVDLYVCYNLGSSHFVDNQGRVTQITPQVAQARYAVYARDWPNNQAAEWRVGKEYAAGEPCAR